MYLLTSLINVTGGYIEWDIFTTNIIYSYVYSEGVEKCIPWNANLTQQIDLAFNIFFMVYFFIRVRL